MDHIDTPHSSSQPPVQPPSPSCPDHLGTTLLLCHGSRPVRVLTLPPCCGKRRLLEHWDDCFGDEVVGWIPWQEIPRRPVDLN